MLKALINISKQQLILPFYHLVSDSEPNFVSGLYKPKTIQQFKTDLDCFLKYYQPITLEQVIHYNKGKIKLEKPSFHLTFDDGLSNFYHIVAPILIEKKIPATVFLNTDFVDNKALFYRYEEVLKNQHSTFNTQTFLSTEKPYLSLKQIKGLQQQGFTFGAHSKNHPNYIKISYEEQLSQTLESVKWIAENLQEKYAVFSFPFYDTGVSKAFFKNIEGKIVLSFGTSALNLDEISTNLQRIDMEKSGKRPLFFLVKKHLIFLIKKVMNKHIIYRK